MQRSWNHSQDYERYRQYIALLKQSFQISSFNVWDVCHVPDVAKKKTVTERYQSWHAVRARLLTIPVCISIANEYGMLAELNALHVAAIGNRLEDDTWSGMNF